MCEEQWIRYTHQDLLEQCSECPAITPDFPISMRWFIGISQIYAILEISTVRSMADLSRFRILFALKDQQM